MNLRNLLTPKDTEEIKPGLFIQKTAKGYRHITPVCWNGNINWKVFFLGHQPLRNFVFFMILMFIVLGYYNDVKEYKNFFEEVRNNPIEYCKQVSDGLSGVTTYNLSERSSINYSKLLLPDK